MKLTLENFFSHLIFNPSDADSEKDQTIAWVATIACGIFSLGACHAICALRNYCFSDRPPEQRSEQDQTISEVKNKALGTQPTKTIEVTIRPEVKKTLDKLFEGSSYSIDALPIYPFVIVEEKVQIDRKKMTAPIMKGIREDGRTFIVMKMDRDYKRVNFIGQEENGTYESLLILFETKKNPLIWSATNPQTFPAFLKEFTNADGSGPIEEQKDGFELLQTLLKTGQGSDINLLVWRTPSQAAQDQKISKLNEPELKTQSSDPSEIQVEKDQTHIEVTIDPSVKITFDQLFEGSTYKIESLPIYPHKDYPERENMTDPIMKGVFEDGRPFIVIKLDGALSDENIKKLSIAEDKKKQLRAQPKVEDILVLCQNNKMNPKLWTYAKGEHAFSPSFFTYSFTDFSDGSVNPYQEYGFKLIQELMKNSVGTDREKIIWQIPKPD